MKTCFVCIALLTILLDLQAQPKKFPSDKNEKQKFNEAQKFFEEGDYERAFECYDYLNQVNPGHIQIQLPLALCVQNLQPNAKTVLRFFERVNINERQGTEFPFYYGLCLHKNYLFEEAIAQMKMFLTYSEPTAEQKQLAQKTIEYCEKALSLASNDTEKNGPGDENNEQQYEYAINYLLKNKTEVTEQETMQASSTGKSQVREPYIDYVSRKTGILATENREIYCQEIKACKVDLRQLYADGLKLEEPRQISTASDIKIMPIAEFLDFNHPDLSYRIQVGSFYDPENIKSEKFKELKCVKETTEKGGIRYTIQDFKTLREAYAFRDEIIAKGMKDAFVTAMFKGKRVLLVDVRAEIAKSIQNEIN
ncbi:MAG TPA: SPOR domain-containing protein [Flavobacteriales bacterium]|nr:SPOR domain-containing protein [Flavobacteriales bacterium]